MADMTVTVTMAAEEFVEFLEWKKDRAVYSAQLVKMRRLPEVIYKKLEYALEPDPKKGGEIQDHRSRTPGRPVGHGRGVFRKIKENHLRLVLTTRRRWRYKRRETRLGYTYYNTIPGGTQPKKGRGHGPV